MASVSFSDMTNGYVVNFVSERSKRIMYVYANRTYKRINQIM